MPIKIQVLNNILEMNDSYAAENRRIFEANNSFAMNMMSSPGSGKTTLLERTLERLEPSRVAIIEGDMQTTKDAERLERFGSQIVQISTGNACHLDGKMVHDALADLDLSDIRLLVIENVGNLVCPASPVKTAHRLGKHVDQPYAPVIRQFLGKDRCQQI